MFSGIVSAVGVIESITPLGDGVRLKVDTKNLGLEDIALGDSIAHNGVCLTVVELAPPYIELDVSHETLRCTTGLNQAGTPVNLEKALRLSDRLGGHLVTGHVDGVGQVTKFEPLAESMLLEVEAPTPLARYIASKGSITINGVSLTVNAVQGARFCVNLIPHTVGATTLQYLKYGAPVNLEIDLIARYCERLLSSTEQA